MSYVNQETPSVIRTIKLTQFITRRWLAIFLVMFGIFNFLPFMAPVFMNAGQEKAGTIIYTMYSPLCHQMAQRSFFLFGSDIMMDAEELPVQLTGDMGTDTLILRRFRGNSDIGWKVAWSDRMVYMYVGTWLAALIFAIWRRNKMPRPIPIWLFVGLLMVMGIDGVTHMLSDLEGLTQGFRYANAWLATLTGHVFPESFYYGDTPGSFNSLMRLISGVTFGVAVVGLIFPLVHREMEQTTQQLSAKLGQWHEKQQELFDQRKQLLEHLDYKSPDS